MLLVTSRAVTPAYCARVRSSFDVEARAVERLLDARVGKARNEAQLAQQLLRVGVIRLQVRAADLQVDRRGRAEVQDLADDVGRQEREGHAGEARGQLFAQHLARTRRSGGGPRAA